MRPFRRLLETGRNLFSVPILVLTYHRITNSAHDPLHLAVQPTRFLAQMEWLRARYPILRPDADFQAVREPSVMITFDDGYADNVLEALPILERLGIPAAFFITTDPVINGDGYWWDALVELVLRSPALPAALEWNFRGATRRAPTEDLEDAQSRLFWRLHDDLKAARLGERNAILSEVERAFGRPGKRPEDRIMNIEELRTLARSPLAIVGLHGTSHVQMASLRPEERLDEIHVSGRLLREITGRMPTLLAYPYGEIETIDLPRSESVCAQAGLSRAFTSVEGVARARTRPFAVPRAFVSDLALPEFIRRVHQNLPR